MRCINYLLLITALLCSAGMSYGQCSGTPVGGTATSNVPLVVGSGTFNLSLSGQTTGTGITYQWQISSCGTWANIASATGTTLSGVSQSAANMYRCVVTCTNSGISTPSNAVWVGRVSAAYCSFATGSGCIYGDGMNTFTLTGACATSISNVNMGCPGVYLDYSGTSSVKMIPGSSYSGSINSVYCCSQNARIYIDFNDNGNFEASEQVWGQNGIGQNPTLTNYSFTLPASATYGTHRMRAFVVYSGIPSDGCGVNTGTFGYGTCVDYTAVIIPANPTFTSNSPACASTLTLTATPNLTACGAIYTWAGSGFSTQTFGSNTLVGGIPATGTYSVSVSVNGASSCANSAATAITVLTSPSLANLTNNATPACAGSDVTFTGTTPVNVSSYSWAGPVAVTGGPVAVLPSATTAASGTYTLTVTAASGCTAKYTTTATVNAKPTVGGLTPSTTSLCTGNPLMFTAGAVTGVGALTSYNWTGPNSFNTTGTSSTTSFTPSTSLASGIYSLTVTYPGFGCTSNASTATVAVNTTPTPISGGTTVICSGTGTSMSSTPVGGTWYTGSTDIATVAGAGNITGVSGGETIVTYAAPGGCTAFRNITVNPTPAYTVSPSTPSTICIGTTVPASLTTSPLYYSLLNQNFNDGMGGWSIANGTGPAGSFWTVVSSPAPLTGLVGDGTSMLQSNPLGAGGMTTTRLTSPAFSTVGYSAATLNFNGYLLSDATDGTVKVEYSTNGGGAWADVVNLKNTISPATTWSAANPQYSIALPAGALGSGSVILRWNYNGNYTWAIDNISVKVQLPASTTSWSGPAGLSCTNCSSPNITPTATGSNVYTGTVAGSAGCNATANVSVSVNALPGAITGSATLCEGATSNLASSGGSGTWTSSDASKVSVNMLTGTITGEAAGTATVTYTISASGCYATTVATVLPAPSAISPTASVLCAGNTMSLSSLPAGGIWNSGNTTVATVSSTGLIGGAAAGTSRITYTISSGCSVYRDVTVNALPADISGSSLVCVGATTALSNTDAFGTWISANSGVASVNSVSGEVLGVSQGNTTITYTLPTGCYKVKAMQANPQPVPTNGDGSICVGATTTLFNATGGGAWTSSAPAVASVNSSGVVTAGSFAGSADIYYTLVTTGCSVAHNIVVNPLPQNIAGPSKVCKDASITLTNSDLFGTWNSGDATIASVDGTGMVTGTGIGSVRITYTLPTGCMTSKSVTVNQLPNNISGNTAVCVGSTTSLINTTPLGTWSSSDVATATVSSVGQVSPVAAIGGNVTITYMVTATGCYKTHDMAVNPLPASIDGTTTLCLNNSTILSNVSTSGTWTSSNSSIVTINSTSGAAAAVGTGNATVTYTLPTGCRTTAGMVVNPVPQDIYGTMDVCAGRQTTLGTLSSGGNWTSSNSSVASVNSTGVVTGNSSVTVASTANISYVFSTGCYKTEQVVVNPLPATITGNFAVCVGNTTDLASADGGGAWTSSSPTAAPVSVLGTVSGMSAGGAVITYTLPTGCMRTQAVVVNPLPGAITGTASVCENATTDLNNATTGGTWSSETMAVGTVDASSGLVAGIEEGTTNIVYTLPTGCSRSRAVVVNATPDPIGGTLSACLGQTSQLNGNPANGVWTSGASSVAAVNAMGLVSANGAGAANITYTLPAGCRTVTTFVSNPLPANIGGTRVVCKDGTSTLTNATPNGTWGSANSFIAGIDANTGLMTGSSAGVTSVVYTLLTTGCSRSANVTVNALPSAITGNSGVCVGATTSLATSSTGGAWSSSNPTVASVSNTGVVSGNTAGNADIYYTFGTGCRATASVVVNALPADITGATSTCFGQQATVFNTTGGGTWTIDNPGVGNIDVNGVVTGMGTGSAVIKYTVDATGCYKTRSFTVNALPAAIMGNMSICQGASTTLTNATPNGTWSSSNSGIAPINSATGSATGFAVGFSIIQYTLPTGCSANTTLVVNALPEPITGTNTMCVGAGTQLESNTMGGTWSSSSAVASVDATGMVNGVAAGTSVITYMTGNGCRRIRIVSVNALPAMISGTSTVCPGLTTTLGNTANGGSWMSDDMAVATISGTGVVTPATTTGGTANMVYTLPTGCSRSKQITVHPAVDAVTGDATVCKGSNTTMANTMVNGAWSSSNTSVATVNAAGVVTGTGAGVANIVYTMPTGCKSAKQIVVNPLPGNISGPASVCDGYTVSLGNTIAGGTWSSSDVDKATISGTGAVTGIEPGSTMITYTLSTGCMASRSMMVNNLPAVKNVTGGGAYCAGGTGVAIGVDGSEPGMMYKLMAGGSVPVLTITGGGGVVNFGNQTGAGTYIVTGVTPEGCMVNMNGTAVITINSLITPSVTLASDKGSTVCAGTSVTYTATGANGGSTPTFNWMVNGSDMGATGAYTYVPANGDIVSVRYNSSESCASPANATSQMTMSVRENLTPAVTINAEPGNKLCAGQTATYRATIQNGGAAPTYSWMVDGTAVAGATNATYSYNPDNNDLVVCKLNSSYGCTITNGVSSNGITMEMAPVYTPVVVVTATPGTTVQKGTEVTYTATVTNAGPTPSYQWLVNMEEIGGATNPVFKTNKLKDGDSVTCRVTGTGECSRSSINSVVMEVTESTTTVATTMIGNSEIRLMPNPNAGVFTVSGALATKADETVGFEVTNVLGQVIYKGNATAKAGVIDAKIELGNNLANGMYMLNMAVGTERKAFHFVVKQ